LCGKRSGCGQPKWQEDSFLGKCRVWYDAAEGDSQAMPKTTLLTLCAWVLATPAWADDSIPGRLANWHQWRGPEANGTAPRGDPPITWDEQTHIKWKAALPGRGSATPIVWGDQVFVLSAIKTDRTIDPAEQPKTDPRFEKKTTAPTNYYQFVVLSFDRQSGKLRWKQTAAEKVPHEGHHPTHSYAAGSPTTDGKYLYVSFGSFGTYCYNLDGKLQWQRDLGRLNTRFGWGEAVTPVIHGDGLLLNYDQEANSALICLDARTGKTRWKAERDEKTSWNTPLVVVYQGRAQVVVNGSKRVRCYDLETGSELWQCGGMTVNAIPSLVARDGVVYCVSGYQGSAGCAIQLGASGDLTDTDKVLWRYAKGTPYVPSPLLLGDRLVFTQGNNPLITSLDIKSGRPVLYRERLPGQTSLYGSPVAAAGRIYLVDRNGAAVVLKQGEKLEVLAANRLDDQFDASPAIAGKQLFLRGQKSLYCIETK
jgi:outer membrane protein assembly factor BamB